jgi:hypothetical protein
VVLFVHAQMDAILLALIHDFHSDDPGRVSFPGIQI